MYKCKCKYGSVYKWQGKAQLKSTIQHNPEGYNREHDYSEIVLPLLNSLNRTKYNLVYFKYYKYAVLNNGENKES